MSSTIKIYQINNKYSEQIINLILPIQQIEFNVPVTLEDQPDLLNIESFYQQGGGNFWGAKYNDELVGTIALINTGHKACALRKMFVKKEFRGNEFGIAQLLLDKFIQFCRDNDITDIYLGTVDILKAACRFYEKNGFTEIKMASLPEYFPRMAADNKFYHLAF
ncbi:MAG: GNAT family N-acetyltransferase [Candidatus Pedobacter colombiensis]|uniref:GNAT family N-acetyltransferase n=1 Tax=Candidatus Pedobacter colombiensis TaxID=3121371 RepID=A0AAJ5WCU5_9SPHI|nr:GNAT family N-acetyltransferase [Pedobacter sp.]WEK21718.1 MAG: GNAT family N-acetyltransferase [Pedobacter sp.]